MGGVMGVQDPRKTGYKSTEVCKLLGINYRTLDYWDTSGLLKPSLAKAKGTGTRKLYSFDDVEVLNFMHKVRDQVPLSKGFVTRLRRAVRDCSRREQAYLLRWVVWSKKHLKLAACGAPLDDVLDHWPEDGPIHVMRLWEL